MHLSRDGTVLRDDGEVLIPSDIVKMTDPVPTKDREMIEKVMRFWKKMPEGSSAYIGGEDRSFDWQSDTYGNSFHDFTNQEPDEPMGPQEQAEFLLMRCFTDIVLQMMSARTLTAEQAEYVIWVAKKGMLIFAASSVLHFQQERKKEEANGDRSRSTE